jgi:hypothetical protein
MIRSLHALLYMTDHRLANLKITRECALRLLMNQKTDEAGLTEFETRAIEACDKTMRGANFRNLQAAMEAVGWADKEAVFQAVIDKFLPADAGPLYASAPTDDEREVLGDQATAYAERRASCAAKARIATLSCLDEDGVSPRLARFIALSLVTGVPSLTPAWWSLEERTYFRDRASLLRGTETLNAHVAARLSDIALKIVDTFIPRPPEGDGYEAPMYLDDDRDEPRAAVPTEYEKSTFKGDAEYAARKRHEVELAAHALRSLYSEAASDRVVNYLVRKAFESFIDEKVQPPTGLTRAEQRLIDSYDDLDEDVSAILAAIPPDNITKQVFIAHAIETGLPPLQSGNEFDPTPTAAECLSWGAQAVRYGLLRAWAMTDIRRIQATGQPWATMRAFKLCLMSNLQTETHLEPPADWPLEERDYASTWLDEIRYAKTRRKVGWEESLETKMLLNIFEEAFNQPEEVLAS